MARPRHPKKEVEAAVRDAERKGWRVVPGGHWGRLFCPQATQEGCIVIVNGTPKNAGDHARRIRALVNKCAHQEDEDHEDL